MRARSGPGRLRRGDPALAARDPVGNNVAATLVEGRLTGLVPAEPDAYWLRVLAGDELVGVAVWTPPRYLLLTRQPPAGVEALAEHLYAERAAVPGVTGPDQLATAFAHRWRSLTGRGSRPGMGVLLHQIHEVRAPTGVPGRSRDAGPADLPRLVAWADAFHAEAVPHQAHPDQTGAMAARVARRLVRVWAVGGEPVGLLHVSPPAAGVVRISGVYTPPARRGCGYASALVAAASQEALRTHAGCVLYTDRDNATSNKIYRAVGYRLVGASEDWAFTD